MRLRAGFVGAVFALAGLAVPSALAHEQAIGFTEVTVIQSDDGDCSNAACRLEVAHRLIIHDAESTLMDVLGARADLVGDRDAQARFETYVTDRFAIGDAETETAFELTLLGGEVERGHYWVYQEAVLDQPVDALSIAQGVLMDAIPAQTNRVNVKYDGRIKTLIFSSSPRSQTLSLD